MDAKIMKSEWVLCPFCQNKTRIKIRYDTELKKLPSSTI
ncbi:MAG: hypothetical protein J1E03_13255 [Acetatifactor sp.]|nr:hypothetical protein [Acetatifactor sp.]